MTVSASRKPLSAVGEFSLVRLLHKLFGQTDKSVLTGIGDDAALLRQQPRAALVATTDLLIEGIHFDLTYESYEDLGYKAAVANHSDIAAMGGAPQYLLVAVAIPDDCQQSDVQALYRGLSKVCRRYRVDLVGGDTSASRQGLFLSLTLLGTIEPKLAIRRSGASEGDLLYVTGTVGDALAGLSLLRVQEQRQQIKQPSKKAERFLVNRHRRPTPRIKAGRILARYRLATAAIDLSDGLSGDLAHICRSSRVGVALDSEALPISQPCRAYAARNDQDPIQLALTGGEDYELLFTVSPRNQNKLDRIAKHLGCPITKIGTIKPREYGMRVTFADRPCRKIHPMSYEHFRQ